MMIYFEEDDINKKKDYFDKRGKKRMAILVGTHLLNILSDYADKCLQELGDYKRAKDLKKQFNRFFDDVCLARRNR